MKNKILDCDTGSCDYCDPLTYRCVKEKFGYSGPCVFVNEIFTEAQGLVPKDKVLDYPILEKSGK